MSTERINVDIIGESEKAYRVRCYGETVWMPKSQIEQMKRDGDKAEIIIPHWLFVKNFGE